LITKTTKYIKEIRSWIDRLYGEAPDELPDIRSRIYQHRRQTVDRMEPHVNRFAVFGCPVIGTLCYLFASHPANLTLALTFFSAVPLGVYMQRFRGMDQVQSRFVTFVIAPLFMIGTAIAFYQVWQDSVGTWYKMMGSSIYLLTGGILILFNFSYHGEVIFNLSMHLLLGAVAWQGEGWAQWMIVLLIADLVNAGSNCLFFHTLAKQSKYEFFTQKMMAENDRLKFEAFEREVSLAQQVQESLGSKIDSIRFRGMQVNMYQERHQSLSGDWMGARVLANGDLVLAVADVTGKGIAAAMVARAIHALWARAESSTQFKPEIWLEEVNSTLRSMVVDHPQTATIGVAVVSIGKLSYYSCGHIPLYYKCAKLTDGRFRGVMKPGGIIGIDRNMVIRPVEVQFTPNDLLSVIIGTDGVFHRGTRTSPRDLEAFIADLGENGVRAIHRIPSNDDKMLIWVNRDNNETSLPVAS